MNPIIYKIGSIEIRAFTGWVAAGVIFGIALVLGMAFRQPDQRSRLMRWLDALLGAVVVGIIGARAFHVWLNWSYFSVHTDQITAVTSGGLNWHGAILGGLLGAIVVGLLRRVPLHRLLDALALVLPFGAITGWIASATASATYGIEVRTLADFPAWLVIESPDVYGVVAPRLNLLPAGIILAVIVLAVVLMLTAIRWLVGLRLWVALALLALGMAVIDFFRADYVPMWGGRRADHWLDVALAIIAILILLLVTLYRLIGKTRRGAVVQTPDLQGELST
ncbi:MAG: prolipoprotein diacylglyceryl transferase [Anaerolineae bacterium]|nr:prolipoprotein diacylglyceryl transferase [Anaerolineae bacterium]